MANKVCPCAYGDGKLIPCLGDKCELFVVDSQRQPPGQGHCALRGLASLSDIAGSLHSISTSLMSAK